MFDFSVLEPYMPLLAGAVWVTLKFTFFSTIMGFLGGFILALITLSKNKIASFLPRRTFPYSAAHRFWCSLC